MTRKITWEAMSLKLRDGHPSNEGRRTMEGVDDDGFIIYGIADVPCGEWYDGHQVLCDSHEELFKQDYPQGWAYYPGDTCRHGMYTGGVGVDWMCGPCEMGEE